MTRRTRTEYDAHAALSATRRSAVRQRTPQGAPRATPLRIRTKQALSLVLFGPLMLLFCLIGRLLGMHHGDGE